MSEWMPAATEIRRLYRLDKWVLRPDELPLAANRHGRPYPLPMRVEMFWRRENFAPVVQMNLCKILRLDMALDIPALEQALRQLIQRHEPLRSLLMMLDGSPVQQILGDAPFCLEVTDLSSNAEDERAEKEAQLVFAFAQQPIDLFSGPTFRAGLLRSGENDFVLGILLHHYFGDAKSLQVISNDLFSLYFAIVSGRPAALPQLRWQYADYALWQRNFAAPQLENYLEYWATRLAGVPWLGLSPQGKADTRKAGMLTFALPAETSLRKNNVAREARATLFAVLFAAYQRALAHFSGQQDIVTAITAAPRARREFAETVGYLMNALPVRTQMDPSADSAALLKALSAKLLADYFRQDISYELLEDFFPGSRPVSTNMFNFIPLGFTRSHPDLATREITPYSHPSYDAAMLSRPRVRVMTDFVFFLTETAQGLDGIFLYNPDYFSEAGIRTLIGHFADELDRLTA